MDVILVYLFATVDLLLVEYPFITICLVALVSTAIASKIFNNKPANKQLLQQLENTLKCFETYGCSDAPRFPLCIAQDKRNEILTRYANIPAHKLRYEAEANKSAAIAPGKHYNDFLIKKLALLIDKANSGCCTTLAICAVHKLLKLIDEDLPGHRIEMVTSSHGMGSHCFIIFNRAGIENLDLIGDEPNISAWGTNFLIIDPWAQSLGHGSGVYTHENYPFQYYLTNLTQTYDSWVDHQIPTTSLSRSSIV
ncbi:hypothetical protein [Candidatus Berkiella aquae]|uniref:Uncharacterized protein n=1 Tax=Candidatus Berkiella aquae TaxID=295108 RepID=A0A0Q9YSJ8_9GAMM|nr:hypothetical protein [Candidatus Berkiella aquae]MCS5711635.1 hypothetical protein [Candidatus Berkiella aquae]